MLITQANFTCYQYFKDLPESDAGKPPAVEAQIPIDPPLSKEQDKGEPSSAATKRNAISKEMEEFAQERNLNHLLSFGTPVSAHKALTPTEASPKSSDQRLSDTESFVPPVGVLSS